MRSVLPSRFRPARACAAVALTTGALAAALAAWAVPAGASTTQFTIFDAPHEFRGSVDGDNGRQAALNEIDAFGADTVRMLIFWRDVAPLPDSALSPEAIVPTEPLTDPASYDFWAQGTGTGGFGAIDAVVRGAASRGLNVMLVPSGKWPSGRVPVWASNDPSGSQSDPKPTEFQKFMQAIGTRYRGDFDPGDGQGVLPHVDILSPWNEGNGNKFLQPQGADGSQAAAIYRSLLNAAQDGLAASGWLNTANSTLLVGETAPRDSRYAVDPINFIRRVYCLNASWRPINGCTPPDIDEDGFSHHPYSFGSAPYLVPSDPTQINMGNLGALATALNKIDAALPSVGNLPIYITEYGADGDPARPERIATQAEYIGIAERIAYENPRVRSFSQYQLRDDVIEGDAGIASGLRPTDSAVAPCGAPNTDCKPAYAAFRTPLAVRTVGRAPCLKKAKKRKGAKSEARMKAKCKKLGVPPKVSIWGRVRPDNDPAKQPRQARVQYRDGQGWKALSTVTVDPNGYFTLGSKNVKGRNWRLVWNGIIAPPIRAYTY